MDTSKYTIHFTFLKKNTLIRSNVYYTCTNFNYLNFRTYNKLASY